MASLLRTAVYSEMLCAGKQLDILTGCVALQGLHYACTHTPVHIRVFAIALLAAAPPGVTEDIHCRCPEAQTLVLAHLPAATRFGVFSSGFVAHRRKHTVNHLIIKRGRHADTRRKHRGKPVAPDTVQSLAPPVERRDTKALNSRRTVHHQTGFLIYGKTSAEVGGTLLRAE